MTGYKSIILTAISLAAIAGVFGIVQAATSYPEPQPPMACTMEAMQCPDGTWVGRTGPNCEFVCPGSGLIPHDPIPPSPIVPPAPTEPGTAPAVIQPGIRFQMRGAAVLALQKRLVAEGYLSANLTTGYFGPLTLAAVKRFQAANGIPTTGYVGVLTAGALNAQ